MKKNKFSFIILLAISFLSCKKNKYEVAFDQLDKDAIYMATSSLQSIHNIWAFSDFIGRKNYYYGNQNFNINIDSTNANNIKTELVLPKQNVILYYYDSTKTNGKITYYKSSNYPAFNSVLRIELNNFYTMGHYFSGHYFAKVFINANGLRIYKLYGDSLYVKLNSETLKLKLNLTSSIQLIGGLSTTKISGSIESIGGGKNAFKLTINSAANIEAYNDYGFIYSITGSKFYYFHKGKFYFEGANSKGNVVYGVSEINPKLATFLGDNEYRFGIDVLGF